MAKVVVSVAGRELRAAKVGEEAQRGHRRRRVG